jgi:hypothetical protein
VRLRAVLLLALVAAALGGCSSGGGSAAPTTTTTTEPLAPVRRAVADRALLTAADAPAGWSVAPPSPPAGVGATCPTIQQARDRAGRTPAGRSTAVATLLSSPAGLPSVRQQAALFATVSAARAGFRERVSLASATCALRGIVRALRAGGDVSLANVDLRRARPGSLGDEARSWLATTRAGGGGVLIDVRIEQVTFRVDRLVVSLIVSSSPTFPLAAQSRTSMLQRAVAAAVAALS